MILGDRFLSSFFLFDFWLVIFQACQISRLYSTNDVITLVGNDMFFLLSVNLSL